MVSGNSIAPTTDDATVTFVPPVSFRRGDANIDGSVDIADAITILSYLFSGGSGPCLRAMDGNGDHAVDIADALYLLSYINGLGPAPVAPFPACGLTRSVAGLTCTATACP